MQRRKVHGSQESLCLPWINNNTTYFCWKFTHLKTGQKNGAEPFMYILYRNVGATLVLFIIALISYRKIEIPTKR